MSLNWAMIGPTNEPIPLPEEEFILHLPGAEITLNIPPKPPMGEDTAGGSGGAGKRLVALGTVWVTDQRVIHLPAKTKDAAYTSLSLPLPSITSTSFVQPLFGANHLVMTIHPTMSGGLTDGTKAEVRFKERGVFEFVKVLEAARERALHKAREKAAAGGGEPLPMYSAPPPAIGSSMAPEAPPQRPGGMMAPEDAPPGYEL